MIFSQIPASFLESISPYLKTSTKEISQKYNLSIYNVYTITFLCTFVAILASYLFYLSRRKSRVMQIFENEANIKPRFRKRDKLMYYANQFEHKFHDLTDKIKAINSKDEKTKLMVDYTKSILGLKKDEPSHNIMPHFPKSYLRLEEDEPTTMSHDLKIFSNALNVFGQINYNMSVNLFKQVDFINLEKGEYLFHENDPKNSIYVVKFGSIDVLIKEEDRFHVISQAKTGESIHSLIVCLMALTGKAFRYRSVMAKASEASEVMRLPSDCFAKCFDKIQMARIIQMIWVRFQHTTFLAFNRYLNLNSELFAQDDTPLLEDSCISNMQQMAGEINRINKIERSEDEQSCDSHTLDPKSTQKQDPSANQSSKRKSNKSRLGVSDFKRIFKRKSISFTTKPSSSSPCSMNEILEAAHWDLTRILNLSESAKDLLSDSLVLTNFSKGSIIDHPHEFQSGLIYVVDGEIEVSAAYFPTEQKLSGLTRQENISYSNRSYSVFPGQLAGILGLITGEPNYFQFTAREDTICVVLPRNNFYKILKQSPDSLLSMYHIASEKMSDLLYQIYYSIEWVTVKAGKALYRIGESSEHMFIILNGRLRQISVDPLTNENTLICELTKGHITGLEMLNGQDRLNTVMAIRDSECVRLPLKLLDWLKMKHPKVINRLFQVLCSKLVEQSNNPIDKLPQTYMNILDPNTVSFANTASVSDEEAFRRSSTSHLESLQTNSSLPVWSKTLANLKTIAILPATPEINGEAFALELQHSLSSHSSAILLTSSILFEHMGPSALEPSQNYRFLSWLSHLEENRDLLLLVCDPYKDSLWTQKCINQCDCILLLHHAADQHYATQETAVEKFLSKNPTKTTKILVLMHKSDTLTPVIGQTVEWLRTRHWICQHYHIRCPSRIMKLLSNEELNTLYSQVFSKEKPNPLSDMSRLARYLTGRAVGLVLGGGGARGCSHVGIIRVFQEVGIPIDMVGGTSIGAFMGALWARENIVHKFCQTSRDFSKEFGSLLRKLTDLTYPAVSFFTGSQFNNDVHRAIGDVQIEDLWLPYFNVTTDITNCKMRIHTNGSLWRYVRSSMTLTGYLPPLCDPYDGAYLLDGGYMNNVPADVMASLGAKTIFAVDVGSSIDTKLTNYGDFISGWWYLWKTFFSSSSFRIPNMIEIQSRLAYVSCVKHLEQIKQSGICHYLRPPIEKYFTLQFNLFDEISDVGYQYGRKIIEEWSQDEKMKKELAEIDVYLTPEESNKCHNRDRPHFVDMPDIFENEELVIDKKIRKNILDESEYPIIDLGDVIDEFDLRCSNCPTPIKSLHENNNTSSEMLRVESEKFYNTRRKWPSFSIDYHSKSGTRNSSSDSVHHKETLLKKKEAAKNSNNSNASPVTFNLNESDPETEDINDNRYGYKICDISADQTNYKLTYVSPNEYELMTNSDPENTLGEEPSKAQKKRFRRGSRPRSHSESRRKQTTVGINLTQIKNEESSSRSISSVATNLSDT